MKDKFVQYFVSSKPRRASPLINRGTYARAHAMEIIIREFIQNGADSEMPRQVVSLGAGNDTVYWRLREEGIKASGGYFELDFELSVKRKRDIVLRNEALRQYVREEKDEEHAETEEEESNLSASKKSDAPSVKGSTFDIHSKSYHLIGVDLCDTAALRCRLERAGLNPKYPTLLLAECVLMYMPPEPSSAVISWAGAWFSSAVFATYEPFRPDDKFGQMMLTNFARRGCDLKTMTSFPTLDTQRRRYSERGWPHVRAADMLHVFDEHLPRERVKRVVRLELFDEFEEWRLIQSHYVLVIAIKGKKLVSSMKFMEKACTADTSSNDAPSRSIGC